VYETIHERLPRLSTWIFFDMSIVYHGFTWKICIRWRIGVGLTVSPTSLTSLTYLPQRVTPDDFWTCISQVCFSFVHLFRARHVNGSLHQVRIFDVCTLTLSWFTTIMFSESVQDQSPRNFITAAFCTDLTCFRYLTVSLSLMVTKTHSQLLGSASL
jgi:hypothetical protein